MKTVETWRLGWELLNPLLKRTADLDESSILLTRKVDLEVQLCSGLSKDNGELEHQLLESSKDLQGKWAWHDQGKQAASSCLERI